MIGPSVERFHQTSGMPTEKIYEMLRMAQPVQRLGTPEEIGKEILFLLSEDCPFMTGSLVSADGGYTCQ
jgi:NAD(P)-dependent dehydrogenase (short-subunit alcohol dehydrogenase family)